MKAEEVAVVRGQERTMQSKKKGWKWDERQRGKSSKPIAAARKKKRKKKRGGRASARLLRTHNHTLML